MSSRTILLWTNRLLWTVLVGAVLALGLFVSLGRYYIPYVETHQQQLVAELNQRTGLRFSIGHIRGYWQRIAPRFVIDDLRLYNPQNPDQVVLQLDHAEVQLGVFRSLNAHTLAISRLQGRGVHVLLEEAPLGQWHLRGFETRSGANIDAVLDLLLAIYRADLTDSHIDLQFVDGAEAHLAGKNLLLQRAGDFRRLNLALAFAENAPPFTLLVEAYGDPRNETFTARGYAALHNLDLTPVLPIAKAFGVNVQHGRIDSRVWLDWRAGSAIEVRGNAALPQLDIGGFSAAELPPVTDIKTEFLLRTEAGRFQLWLPHLTGKWSDSGLDLHQLTLSAGSAQPDIYQLTLPELHLAPLRDSLLASKELPAQLRDIVSVLEPHGVLRNIRLDLPRTSAQKEKIRLRAELDQVEVRPWQGAPGVEGASGYIDAGLQDGVVDLASDKFTMEFPHVYREPLQFDRVRGQIGWRNEGEHVLVNSGPIPVHSDAGVATAQFALDIPTHHGGTASMTLMVGLRDSAAQYRNRFIPYTLPPALLDWLQSSVRAGAIPLGGFIYRGALTGNDPAAHSVQLFLDVRDGELAYQPDWPPLHDLRAAVWLDDSDLLVQAPTARIFENIFVNNVSVELHHPASGSWLTVRGDAIGENNDVLRVLRESAVRKHIGAALDAWSWRGTVRSQLDLGIPLGGTKPAQLNIESELGPGTLLLANQQIAVTDVRGPLSYSSDRGLQTAAITARWYGKPLTIRVATETSGEMGLQFVGRIGMTDLKDWLHEPLFDYAEGETAFDARLRIAGEKSAVTVSSDLLGATVRLPPPYSKSAEQKLPFELRMSVGAQRELLAELSDWGDLRLRWDDRMHVDAGVLRLGNAGKTNFVSRQMIITGHLPTLDVDAWSSVLKRDSGTTATEKPADAALELYLRELQFDSVSAFGQTLDGLVLSGHRETDAWRLGLNARQLGGIVRVPDKAQQPVSVKLDYLRFPAPAPVQAAEPVAGKHSALEQIDPAKIIPVDLSIDHLWRGNEELGSLAMQLRPIDSGLRLDNISGQLRGITIAANGEQPAKLLWTRSDGVHRSELNARLQIDDSAQALQRWQYEPVLTSKRGEINIAVRWSGAPDQFEFTRVDGDIDWRIDDGRFLKASSSATGALKVVGIFNFANFLKRLKLDFSDVFKDGVSFDEMKGGVAMHEGVLKTVEPVEIKSPSSRFRIAGQIDFNTDQTNMELVATLPVASILPWVAVLAGGLPAAAGVYVAGNIFQSQVDKFSSAAYDITGPWTDPKVKLRGVFDDNLQQKTENKNTKKIQEAK